MSIDAPTPETLAAIAAGYHLHLSDADAASFAALAEGSIASCRRLDELAAALSASRPVTRRAPGSPPDPADNRLGAWAWRTAIRETETGPLAGKTVAIKDNVSVAGVPMTNGTDVLDGYLPERDATVVTRILEAGGTILGKAVCESLCFSGGSHTSNSGPVRNPYDPTRTTGGSSSGSAALVANRDVDLAVGGDQGGSVRIPACWTGIYGLKPTWGLVPYTGAFPIEATLDHLGPMAATTRDVALLLSVLAGPDGWDPRQAGIGPPEDYLGALSGDLDGLRIGVVEEGFGWPDLSDPHVDEEVGRAGRALAKLGASVEPVSIPWHRDGVHIWSGIASEGATMLMVAGNGMGTNWKGRYAVDLLEFFGAARRQRADQLSETTKLTVLVGQYLQDRYHGRYYAIAQNLAALLAEAYDNALDRYDLLAMPTLPMTATRIPAPDAPREEYVARALEMLPNTAPFDVTGHPAMNVPCGLLDGLPVGMMLVGRRGQDATVLRASDAFERAVFSPPSPL